MTARVRALLARLRNRRRLDVDDPIEMWLTELGEETTDYWSLDECMADVLDSWPIEPGVWIGAQEPIPFWLAS